MPNSTNNPPRMHMLKKGGKAKMMLHALCGRYWVKEENKHQNVTTLNPTKVTCRRCQIKYGRGER